MLCYLFFATFAAEIMLLQELIFISSLDLYRQLLATLLKQKALVNT